MRILTVSNLYPPVFEGGYELRCAATMDGLRDQHEVFVLTSQRGRKDCPPDPRIRRELPLITHGPRAILRAPLATARGIEVMRRALAELQPDLIFVWNGSGIPHSALRTAELSGIPIAYSVGEHWLGNIYRSDAFMRFLLPGNRGLRALWGRVAQLTNRLPALRLDPITPARAAICWNSDATRRQCGVPPTIVPTHEATIYPAVADPAHWSGLPRRQSVTPTIAFVGRVEEEKGPDVAYRALAHLRDDHGVRARLRLAGPVEPQMRARLERLASELRIEQEVELLGRLDKEGVGRVLSEAHALVVPSTWEEPFGMVLLEGALARVPVVASRCGGMPEALEEGTQALFFEVGDATACAEALAETFDHSSRVEARVEAAFARASEHSFGLYLAEMGQFVSDAHASFSAPRSTLASPV